MSRRFSADSPARRGPWVIQSRLTSNRTAPRETSGLSSTTHLAIVGRNHWAFLSATWHPFPGPLAQSSPLTYCPHRE
jgi:hypothetical protein